MSRRPAFCYYRPLRLAVLLALAFAFQAASAAPVSPTKAPLAPQAESATLQSFREVDARILAVSPAVMTGDINGAKAHLGAIAQFFTSLVPSEGARNRADFVALIALANTLKATDPRNTDALTRTVNQAKVIAQAGLRAEAYENGQWAVQTAAARALAQVGARFAAGTDTLAKVVRERQDLVDLWQAKDAELLAALSSSQTGSAARAEAARTELSRLNAAISTLDARLEREFPEYADLANPKPLTVVETQKLLRPDEALVFFMVSQQGTYIWLVTREEVVWDRAAATSTEIAAQVSALRRQLDPTGGGLRAAESDYGEEISSGAKGFDRNAALTLYRTLFPPIIEAALGTKSRLIVVSSGPLTSLPLGVLVTEPPSGDDADAQALRSTKWLGLTRALTVLPSVASLKALRAFQERARAKRAFQGYGAPTLVGRAGIKAASEASEEASVTRSIGTFFRGGVADVETVRRLEPLPQTEIELKKLATALRAPNQDVTIGDAFTETAVRAAKLDDVRVIAFATHGLLAGELRGLAEPALVLTPPTIATPTDDGLLTASEISQLRLAADWVVLSACNTAAGDKPGAEGLSGLARAFFFAGARALLVSHWPVRDDAAARLTTTAIEILNANPEIGRAEAYRRSMRSLIDDESDPTLAHPSSWAPFELVGEGQ